jgi:Flp pilus assembly protein TadG
VRKIIDRISCFSRDKRGNFGTMFAVGATALLMSTAMAVDVSRMYAVQLKMTQAIDAAVLATTQGLTQGDIPLEDAEEKVLSYINANLDGRSLASGDVIIDNITVDPVNKTLQVDAHSLMDMTMAGLVGYDQHKITTMSKAAYSDTMIEVVMTLDVTGSMDSKIGGKNSPKKIDSLKSAAKLAIETIFDTPDAEDRVRLGLVPYAAAVNAAPVVSQIATTNYTTDCVYERTGSEKYTDAFATSSAKVGGTTSNICPSSEIVPLTNDEEDLLAAAAALSTGGCTAGQVGIAWAYYMLSANWNSAWPEGSDAASYLDPATRKYAIIMTDGIFNYKHSSSSSCNQKKKSEKFAKKLCSAMKADGIRVYAVAFDAPNDAKKLMQNCASDNTSTINYFFDATDDAELEDAFHTIALDIQGLRLIN